VVNQFLPEVVASVSEIARSFAPIAASACGGGVLWKLVDKLIDVSEARRKSREEQEGATNAELREQVANQQKELIDLTGKAAVAELYRLQAEEFKRQRDELADRLKAVEEARASEQIAHRSEVFRLQGDLRQQEASMVFYRRIAATMNTPEGQQWLRDHGFMNP
jgi:hypothetical protein